MRGVVRALLRPAVRRIQLDLVHVRRDARLLEQPVEVRRLEVRDADRADLPVLEEPEEPAPRFHVAVLPGIGPVDQEQVDALEAEALRAVRPRLLRLRLAVPALVELRGDEHLVAIDAARPDPPAHAGLVPVVLGGVDQPVSGSERGRDGLLGLPVAHRRGAEPQRGHRDPVGERDRGDLVHPSPRIDRDASGTVPRRAHTRSSSSPIDPRTRSASIAMSVVAPDGRHRDAEHPGGLRGADAVDRVLHGETPFRRDLQPPRRGQEDGGIGLAELLVLAGDHDVEPRGEPVEGEHGQDQWHRRRRRERDPEPERPNVVDRVARTLEQEAALTDGAGDSVDDRLRHLLTAGFGPRVPPIPAVHDVGDPDAHRRIQILVRELDADAREHLALHRAPHRLRVDQHAVHVEDDGLDRSRVRHHGTGCYGRAAYHQPLPVTRGSQSTRNRLLPSAVSCRLLAARGDRADLGRRRAGARPDRRLTLAVTPGRGPGAGGEDARGPAGDRCSPTRSPNRRPSPSPPRSTGRTC